MVRWRGRRESDNVEDRRGQSGGGGFRFPFPRRGSGGGGFRIPIPRGGGGGRFPFPMPGRGGRGGFSLITIIIIVALFLLFKGDLGSILGGGAPSRFDAPRPGSSRVDIPRMPGSKDGGTRSTGTGGTPARAGDDLARFVKVILADTEDVWSNVFRENGRSYRAPKLVFYDNQTPTGCGRGMAAMGPFYCPLDQKIYVDLRFYNELKNKFGAPGDFAQAYVIAHEVGHHVQFLLGIATKVQQAKRSMSRREANALQVRMELQADCLAGVWAKRANQAKNILEAGDIDEGLRAASAIGDDMIQRRTTGRVVPDAFTHGSSRQRVRWFKRGLEGGDMRACETFRTNDL